MGSWCDVLQAGGTAMGGAMDALVAFEAHALLE